VPDDATRPPAATRWSATDAPRGDDYDRRWDDLAAAGVDPHGEVAFIQRFTPATVLDAGCGTGRVARELGLRGVVAVGVDVDADMLATARAKAPDQEYHLADLATLDLHGRCRTGGVPPFDCVVLAGNVMIFVAPGTEGIVLRRLAAHLAPGGHLIAGFQLQPGRLDLATYDRLASDAGFELSERWSTWSCDPFVPAGASYAVSVHRLAHT
jgi:SAM-dependent methyltransferase